MTTETFTDTRDRFIHRIVAGRTFCDAGGLWGTVKEKVSVAAAAGASEFTMLDMAPQDHALWSRFADRMADFGIADYGRVTANLDAPGLERLAGSYDVVHSSGVLYHCPNPLYTLSQLRRITREHLVLTSIVVPEHIENSEGVLDTLAGQALFLPYIAGEPRAVLKQYFADAGVTGIPGVEGEYIDWRLDDYGPWWWLPSPTTLRRWIESAGFRVLDSGEFWGGRSHAFLAAVDSPP